MEAKYTIKEIEMLINKAERYTKLENQGLLIELPCTLGSMVYRVVPDCKNCSINLNNEKCNNKLKAECKKKVISCIFTVDLIQEFGESVFKTESEAVVASIS